MRNNPWKLIVLMFALAGCEPEEEEKTSTEVFPEFIVFGRFQSTGCGNFDSCVELFRMETGSLREDTVDNIPQAGVPYMGNYSLELSASDYNLVQELFKEKIPSELLALPNGLVGTAQPWTTNFYYFEYKTATQHGYWVIDGSFDGNLGAVIQTFISDIQNAVNIASM